MAGPPTPRDRRDFKIAIICALRLEADCVQAIFDKFWEDEGKQYGQVEGDSNSYTTGVIGEHNVVLAYMPSMGPVDASGTAAYMRSSFPNIKLALIVGICGGVPFKPDGEEIVLGDIVISQSIVQYDSGRQYPGLFEQRQDLENSLGRPSQQIRGFLHKLQTHRYQSRIADSMCSYLFEIQKKLPKSKYPGGDADELYEPSYQHKHRSQTGARACDQCSEADSSICSGARKATCSDLGCDKGQVVTRTRRSQSHDPDVMKDPVHLTQSVPRIHVGRIASGSRVMKWAEERDRIAKSNGVIAFEMEVAGVWEHFPSIMIKGICDYADSHKSKLWQDYSAATAAACTRSFLQEWTFQGKSQEEESPQPIFYVPFDRLQAFIGRSNEIEVLKAKLLQSGEHRRVAVLGLGGAGKSRIALELAYRTKLQRPSMSVFWIQATDYLTFEKDLFEIGKKLEIPGIEDEKPNMKALVSQCLGQKNAGEWLMILDNADDEAIWGLNGALAEYLPTSTWGSILVTTRTRRVAANLVGKDIIELHEMTHVDGIEMLRSNLAKPEILTDLYATISLLARLTYLPLAIAQAAAYITTNDNSIQQYCDILNDSEEEAIELLSEGFNADGRYTNATNPVLLTWLVSFEQIQNRDALAADYLSYMSCLGETGIPQSLLPQAPSRVKMNGAIGIMKAHMIIWERSDDRILGALYDMHPLVRLAVRNWLRSKNLLEYWIKTAIEYMAEHFPEPGERPESPRALYVPHAQVLCDTNLGVDKKERYDLMEKIAWFLHGNGNYDKAVALMSTVVFWREEHLGKEHELTLKSYGLVAIFLRSRGDLADAEKYSVQALNGHRAKFGEDHPDTLKSMAGLAVLHIREGRWQEGEALLLVALDKSKRVLGEEDINTLCMQSDLAAAYQDQGQWDKAEKTCLQLDDTTQTVLGPEHPLTLLNMALLAETYQRRGKLAESEQLSLQVVAAHELAHGPDHVSTLDSISSLAVVYKLQGRLAEAEKLEIQVKEGLQKVLHAEHPAILIAMRNLATTYQHQKRWVEAEELQIHAIEAMKRVGREDHLHMLFAMGQLTLTYEGQERWEEAEQLTKEVIERSKRVRGTDHPDILILIRDLATTYEDQERWGEAEELRKEVIEIREGTKGADHSDTLVAIRDLASTYQAQEKWDEAENLRLQVVEAMKTAHGSEHLDTLADVEKLGEVYFGQERWEETKQLDTQVMEGRKRALGNRDPSTLASMGNLVQVLQIQGDYEQALQLQMQLVSISIELLGPEDPLTIARLDTLQDVKAFQSTEGEAQEFVRQYLEQMGLNPDQSRVAEPADPGLQGDTDEREIRAYCSCDNCHTFCEPSMDDVD